MCKPYRARAVRLEPLSEIAGRILTVARFMLSLLAAPLVAIPMTALPIKSVQAQHVHETGSDTGAFSFQWGAMAIGVLTRAAPAHASRTFTEFQLVQPNLMTSARWRWVSLLATLNGEGYTLRRGELNPGIFGEGYVDRRHPHTMIHEAMLVVETGAPHLSNARALSASVSVGKGFVPFGSDDPMMRPFEKYPVNHHHAQILERVQAVGALRATGARQQLVLEAAVFNGDEPAGPFHGPQWDRVGDSWAARATLQVVPGLEVAASRAKVISPELQQGGAFDHGQRHLSVRWESPGVPANRRRYLLAEWARTDEITNDRTAFRYQTILAEAAAGWPLGQLALRLEQTDRAEQSRLLDPFRTPVGHVSFQILGVTRWNMGTVVLESPTVTRGIGAVCAFVEVTRARPVPQTHPVLFEPRDFYGRSTLWLLTAGLRMHVGTMRPTMGRYGASTTSSGTHVISHEGSSEQFR